MRTILSTIAGAQVRATFHSAEASLRGLSLRGLSLRPLGVPAPRARGAFAPTALHPARHPLLTASRARLSLPLSRGFGTLERGEGARGGPAGAVAEGTELGEDEDEDEDEDEEGEEGGDERKGKGKQLSKQVSRALRAEAHKLGKKMINVQVGKLGVTDSVMATVRENLAAHELIKIKVSDGCPEDITTVMAALTAAAECSCVSKVGRTLVLYKERTGPVRKSRAAKKRLKAGGVDTMRATDHAMRQAAKDARRDGRIKKEQEQKLKARRAPEQVKVVGFDPEYQSGADRDGRPDGFI